MLILLVRSDLVCRLPEKLHLSLAIIMAYSRSHNYTSNWTSSWGQQLHSFSDSNLVNAATKVLVPVLNCMPWVIILWSITEGSRVILLPLILWLQWLQLQWPCITGNWLSATPFTEKQIKSEVRQHYMEFVQFMNWKVLLPSLEARNLLDDGSHLSLLHILQRTWWTEHTPIWNRVILAILHLLCSYTCHHQSSPRLKWK